MTWFTFTVNVGEDCPVFDGLFEFCQLSTGGSVGEYPGEDLKGYGVCVVEADMVVRFVCLVLLC